MQKLRHGLVIAALVLIPLHAKADDATLLGPQGSMGPSSSTNASAPRTGSLLQPAGTSTSPIQSADASAGGITGSQSQALQQTKPADDIKLILNDEAEGEQTLDSSDDYTWLLIILVILVLATLVTAGLVWIDRRRLNTAQ